MKIRKAVLFCLYLEVLLFTCRSVYSQQCGTPGFTEVHNYYCLLRIKGFSGNSITVEYESLPANQAGRNKNSLRLWRASEVPWTGDPLAMVILPPEAKESGSYIFDSVKISYVKYIVCYAVGPEVEETCACAVLNEKDSVSWSESLTLSLVEVKTNSVSFSYHTFAGYRPLTYGNWFGLWKGRASPYNAGAPMASGKPLDDATDGIGIINNVELISGQTYTLIYFTKEYFSSAAAMIRFVAK